MVDKDTLKDMIALHFGVDEITFLTALLSSGNARGYIGGAVSEHLLKEQLIGLGYEVARIREKWVGKKLHHGDFYIRRPPSDNWFVLESKGVKSNAEKWHKLRTLPADPATLARLFDRKSKGELYEWWNSLSARRKKAILESGALSKGQMLETHFVSGTAGRAGRAIATPLKSEFHVVSLDLFLKTRKHEFIFASSKDLQSPVAHPTHLKQNYLIDILVPGVDIQPALRGGWTRDFNAVFARLRNPVKDRDRQLDTRAPGARQTGVDIEADD